MKSRTRRAGQDGPILAHLHIGRSFVIGHSRPNSSITHNSARNYCFSLRSHDFHGIPRRTTIARRYVVQIDDVQFSLCAKWYAEPTKFCFDHQTKWPKNYRNLLSVLYRPTTPLPPMLCKVYAIRQQSNGGCKKYNQCTTYRKISLVQCNISLITSLSKMGIDLLWITP